MKAAQNSFIAKYIFDIPFRIDGEYLVFKLCHQYEEKTLSSDGAHPGEFRRGGDHAGVT